MRRDGKLIAALRKTPEARRYLADAAWLAKEQRAVLIEEGQVCVHLVVHRSSRRYDPTNVPKVLMDALEGVCWKNDRQVTLILIDGLDERIDKDNPRVELTYHKLEPGDPGYTKEKNHD